jgi:hypothetical protein
MPGAAAFPGTTAGRGAGKPTFRRTLPAGTAPSTYQVTGWSISATGLIVDGLKLIEDVGLFIATEGEDVEALVEAIKDVFDVTKDAVKAAAEKGNVDLGKLAKHRKESFQKACASIDVDPRVIKDMGAKLDIGKHWAFIAGKTYVKKIHDDSNLVNGWGWTVLSSRSDDDSVRWIANHAFIQAGHLIQVLDKDTRHSLWKKF